MKTNLARLRGLSENEKTENAMLQSRLDEQSQLIMILKQSSDDKGVRLQTLERINDELTKFRDEAVDKMKRETKKYNFLDARYCVSIYQYSFNKLGNFLFKKIFFEGVEW